MEGKGLKLKDPQTFRIFISSPFNGMERERDSLTKLYWPRLESLLATRGLRLRLVDMRWGITHSSSIDSQTINICLREVDRSDFFIGLYGQRYGWHGTNDVNLQENFEKAKDKFPWILNHREKSVTALEYYHGHLNEPGRLPACFTFRHKSYDDQMFIKARQDGDAKREKAFTPETQESSHLLNDLKQKVIQTETETLGLLNDYTEPEKAAEFIFESILTFVKKEILSASAEPPSKKEKSLLAHEVYMKSRAGNYVGGERYMEELDKYVLGDDGTKPITVIGKTGCGKSALIANWISNMSGDKYSNVLCVYHLVGAEPDSASTNNLLIRLVENLQPHILAEDFDPSKNKLGDKELLAKLQELFKKLNSAETKFEKKIVIIVDKVDHMSGDKTSKPLYWLPRSLPAQIRVVLTVTAGNEGADEILEILDENYQTLKLEVTAINEQDKWTLCQSIMEEHSKSFDEEQLHLIISSPKTNQPFFLMVLIQELCVSGRFRELSQQIRAHLEAEGVTGLLCNVIKRLETDYESDEIGGKLAEDILCAICLCRKGIAESELPMPQHIWAPFIHAMGKYLINKGGLLTFSFPEMAEAVEKLYMNTDEKKGQAAVKVAEIFLVPYRKMIRENAKTVDKRLVMELPYLLKKSGNKAELMKVMSDVRVFNVMFSSARYELNDYWHYLGVSSEVIARKLLKSLDCYTAVRYSQFLRDYNQDGIQKLMRWKSGVIDDIRIWMDVIKLYHGLSLIYDREIMIDTRRSDIQGRKKENILVQVKYFKACFLSDVEQYREALDLHMEVMKGREKLIKESIMEKEDIGMSYHGIGLCYYNLKDYDEGEKWFLKALEAQSEDDPKNASSNGNTYCNLGLIENSRGNLDKAIEYFNKSNALWEDVMPDKICLDIAYNYHNMALVQRKKKNYDEAERMYLKSMKMKERLLGRVSYDVAITLMNLGTVETYRKNNEKSLDYNKQSLEIFKKLAPEGSYRTMMAEENVVNQLTLLKRYEEAEPMFQNVLKHLKKMEGGSANGLAPLHRRFRNWYEDNGYKEKALDVSTGLVTCSKCKPADVAYHLILYDSSSKTTRGPCPHEGTFEYGMKKWPYNRDILMAHLSVLVEADKTQAMDFIQKYCEDGEGEKPGGGRYWLLVDIIHEELEDLELAIKVATQALNYDPDNDKLKCKMEKLKKLQEEKAAKDKIKNEEQTKQENEKEGTKDEEKAGENIEQEETKQNDSKDTNS